MSQKAIEFIAEKRGFHLQTVWPYYVDKRKALKWEYPDGSLHREIPDFPNDLSAQEEWIWEDGWEVTFSTVVNGNKRCRIRTTDSEHWGGDSRYAQASWRAILQVFGYKEAVDE